MEIKMLEAGPLNKTRLYEDIIKRIMDSIKRGDLKPGDKLPTERELVQQLNVSRTAIREALRSLEILGVVYSKVGSGTYIKEMSLDVLMDSFAGILKKNERMIMELIEVRMLLEVEIAKLAAQRITEEKAQSLEKAVKLMEKEIKEGGLGIKGDNAFHNELAIAADNLAMTSILNLCGELLDTTRIAALKALGDPRIGLEHHSMILDAVKKKNSEEAGRLMKEHLEIAFNNLKIKQDIDPE
jgi:GntR family transcriptional repressor for pyruvate dehydrogenase complex